MPMNHPVQRRNRVRRRAVSFASSASCFLYFLYFLYLLYFLPLTSAEVVEKSGTFAGKTVRYKVVLPDNFDPARAYPGVLAFSGGTQTMRTVDTAIDRFWRDEAERRGYIVVIPSTIVPEGWLYFEEDGARIFPEFLDRFLRDYRIQGNKFHIAGNSNGGLSSFYVGANHARYFWSVTGLPGYIYEPTPEQTRALGTLCLHMYVGEMDTPWRAVMEPQAEQFSARGMAVDISVEPGQGHGIRTLAGEGAKRLFDQFEKDRTGCAGQ